MAYYPQYTLIRNWILFFCRKPLFLSSILPSRKGRFSLKGIQNLEQITKRLSSKGISISDLCSIFLIESKWRDMARHKVPINREVLQSRISYIEDSLISLERFKGITFEEFNSNSDNFRIAFYDLHRALEAVMDIGSHILSRIPGARPATHKDIPRLL